MQVDDLGQRYTGPAVASRVVSLVPSLTEAIASVDAAALVGATDWCTHPADLDDRDVARVRGTKNPDVAAIVELAPDIVVANKEENRARDVARLRAAGVAVWVTDIESVPQALASLARLFDTALAWPRPDWLAAATTKWSTIRPPKGRVAVPIWRDPWMVVGGRTYTGDLLHRLGWENAFADHPQRYPRVDVAEIDGADVDLVLLPDEPYPFSATDGPEAFSTAPTRLVAGRLLTWYGPAMIEAAEVLGELAAT